MSARPADVDTRPTEAPSRTRRKVKHLFWVRDLEDARTYGFAVISICGRVAQKPMPIKNQTEIPVVGRLVPIVSDVDCRVCTRKLSRFYMEREKARGQVDRRHGESNDR